jgi:hypothetical protein
MTLIYPHLDSLFTAITVAWIGGFGFVIFRYPELLARFSVRLGMRWISDPKYRSLTRTIGIVEMVWLVCMWFYVC